MEPGASPPTVCTACGADFVDGANFCFKCGAPRPSAVAGDPLIGRTLGSYRVVSVLGEGAMGKVYRAEQTNLGRPVCVKTLLPHLTRDATLVQRFEREARTTSALRHPNIVEMIDLGRTDEGLLYLVMELIEGPNLRAILEAEAPLPLARTLLLQEQILSALEEAHGAGVLHRDLKPENVLVSKLRDGSDLAKVVDFGIAKLVDEGADQRLTGTGLICGTPGYMAPEQILGEELDGRADVYAAGVMFYEMLTGKQPLRGGSIQDMMNRHLHEVPASPSTVSTMPLPAAVDGLCLGALEKRRERRFPSALDFKRALDTLKRASAAGGTAVMPGAAAAAAGPTRPCPSCGHPEPATRKFCGECGTPLDPAAAAAVSSPQHTPLPGTGAFGSSGAAMEAARRLMPQSMAGHLESLPAALAGEKRNVTVIFADLSGFTSMSESMDPEEVRQLMNRCFDGMVEAVHRYEGIVDKFIGDCIMVVFGAPKAHEDDPERALRCAREMLAYMGEVNKTLSMPLGFRIGMNSGEVVAGGVGGQRRMDYTVIGDVVNLAQRLESNARVGSILVSRSVERQTRHMARFTELEPIRVKGKSEPVEVFELQSFVTEEQQATDQLVGRNHELREVRAALGEVREGRGTGRLFLGEAGMGKTRLLQEARELARSEGWLVAEASAARFGRNTGLDLVRDAVGSLCDALPGDEGGDRITRLSALGLPAGQLRRVQTLFGAAPAHEGFEAKESRMLDHGALAELFARAGTTSGLCLILDDLHLADRESLEFLEGLRDRSEGSQLALLASARPGESAALMPKLGRVELEPLSPAESILVARATLGGAELPVHVAESVADRASGNPLFAREIVRGFVDTGMLTLSGGTWTAAPSFNPGTLPDNLALMVAARVDHVSPDARQLMRYGAVVGRMFSAEMVAAAMETPITVGPAVSECVHRGLLRPTRSPTGGLEFVQAVVRESLLSSFVPTDLKHVHLRLAEVIESGTHWGPEHPAEAAARHFLAAGQARKAIRYFQSAARRLEERGLFGGAAEYYREALGLMREQVRRLSRFGEEAATALLELATRAADTTLVASPAEALGLSDTVLGEVRAGLAPRARADLLRARASCLLALGKPGQAEGVLREALASLAGDPDRALQARLFADLGAVREAKGDLPGATHHLMEGFRGIAGAGADLGDLLWRYLNQLGRVHLRAGEAVKAQEFFENARSHAKRAQSVVGEAKALENLASAVATAGDRARALSLFQEAQALCEQTGDAVGTARIHFNLGRLLLAMGNAGEARQRLHLARDQAMRLGWREGLAAVSQTLDALAARTVGS